MSKRIADKELTDRNWDEEDEPEEAGKFKQADQSILTQRKIKTPRRKLSENEKDCGNSPFRTFGGFTGINSKPSSATSFSFATNPTSSTVASTVCTESALSACKSENANLKAPRSNFSKGKYLAQLEKLNRSFIAWIQQHVEKNSYCILSPIFSDYNNHLSEIELLNPDNVSEQKETNLGTDENVGNKTDAVTLCEEEEYAPPKPVVVEVEEEGAVYSKRCKLFYQKNGSWVDKGIGKLHLKHLSSGKSQLVVRADTSLGNILLNIMLTSSIPSHKQGKNNVLLVCVPNPVIENLTPGKAVPFLLRVKTAEDAEELACKVEEMKSLVNENAKMQFPYLKH